MAKQTAATPAGGDPPKSGRQNIVVTYKGSEAFEGWLNDLAEAQDLPVTVLVDHALRDYGRKHGAPPMPKRIPKRTPRRRSLP